MLNFIKKLFGLSKDQEAKVEDVIKEVISTEKKVKRVVKKVKTLADVNNDGKVNIEDATELKKRVVKNAKEMADINKDGKLSKEDAIQLVETAVKKAKRAKKIKEPIALDVVIDKPVAKRRGRPKKAK